MLISILIPVYNTPIEYINECIGSINSQTYQDFEVIIVNDGSNDETTNYLNQINDSKYHIFHKEKEGISKALNYGLSYCKSNIIARMDADDVMMPDRLEKQLKHFIESGVDILGTQMQLFGNIAETLTYHPSFIERDIMLRSEWFMNHPTIMFKKDVILYLGGYDTNFDGLEDYHLWCRALLNNFKLANMSDMLVRHRRHGENATVKNDINVVLQKLSFVRTASQKALQQ